ncbi:MAG: ComEC/Rec2 family competence protein, partial [Gemmatimonadota bacterium]
MRAPLVTAAVVLAAGIGVGAQWPVSPGSGPLVITGALVAAGLGLSMARARPGKERARARNGGPAPGGRAPVGPAPVLFLVLAAGALLGTTTRTATERSCAARLPPELPITVHGRLADRSGDRVELDLAAVELAGRRIPCRGRIPARHAAAAGAVGPDTGVQVGAAVEGAGRWWTPPGGPGLRPVGLLLLDRLGADTAANTVAGVGAGARLVAGLRGAAARRVDRLFGDRAALAASLLLAQRHGLDREVRDRFAAAGLSHLLAISGLHVALVAGILLILTGAARLGRRGAAVAAGAGTVAYVAFLGAPHSAVRAALQIVLVLMARAVQRPARTEALIAAAALAILAVDPGALFTPGFQLSFAGVAGILAFRRPLLRHLEALTRVRVGTLD